MGRVSLWRRWRQVLGRQDKPKPRGQWILLAGRCGADELANPPIDRLHPIYPPVEAFWADPFAWRHEERFYVFFEEYPYAAGRGHISVIELDEQARPLGAATPVLEKPFHLSYPYLFEFEGELYMVPEQKQTRRLDLYRCVEFPKRWERAKTLIPGMRLVDANLFEHEGRWWLLCAAKLKWRGLRYDETLFAFHADSPLSECWTPHPGNPLVRDFSRARPGGRIVLDAQGRLLRPSQDCVRRYGDGLNISEILELSPNTYQERLLWHKSGEEAGGFGGMHHMDWHRGLLVMDAQQLVGVQG